MYYQLLVNTTEIIEKAYKKCLKYGHLNGPIHHCVFIQLKSITKLGRIFPPKYYHDYVNNRVIGK